MQMKQESESHTRKGKLQPVNKVSYGYDKQLRYFTYISHAIWLLISFYHYQGAFPQNSVCWLWATGNGKWSQQSNRLCCR